MEFNVNAWRAIGTNETVITWLTEGIKLDFSKNPEQFYFTNKQFTNKESTFLRDEIQRLLTKKIYKNL